MTFAVYILRSKSLGKYYIGHTSKSMEERLSYHLGKHNGFTSKAKDWEVVRAIELETKSVALQLEKKIKKRGARRFLEASDFPLKDH